jgi:hypothetical protein
MGKDIEQGFLGMKALNSPLTQGPHSQNSPVPGPSPYTKDSYKARLNDHVHQGC